MPASSAVLSTIPEALLNKMPSKARWSADFSPGPVPVLLNAGVMSPRRFIAPRPSVLPH